ncbi:DENN domain and WD repeat-containing protein SCD1 [Gossypium arboreum]|uniref:Stomatal cytokinesis defective 1 n=1 Tax=Gossypium arboreum TaxID=29729 RepID=M4MD11_GOSAR|nr:DENN domain and WD repeat-containing protein SCD1 [Gossypium arboreum]AGG55718.1 stomatal cytokinesis defective 1 [Gossypium arboreum]
MTRIFEYFVVCGLGPEIRTLDGTKGYHGTEYLYLPSLLDQYPPLNHTLYPPPPPQLPTCVLPAGVELFPSGFDSNDPLSYPRSYPIVLTEGDGSKIYVSCITFRDPVCEDIAEAYRIPPNSFADKCICVVSRSPCFRVLREALEEIFALCFSPSGSRASRCGMLLHIVSNVPLPTPGKERVLFAIDNCLLSVEVPPKDGLPHADVISFQPLVQCLDVDNLIKLFTAVLLERRILIRSNKYSLLTLASEAICHLIYPFRWVYIPLLFFSGVDYIDAPTPYMMGLHSGVDTSNLGMDGVVIVDLEFNQITTTEEIPPIPEPELSLLRGEILKLLHPNVVGIDLMRANFCGSSDQNLKIINKPWGEDHDLQLRASILAGYRNFMVFNTQAFLKKRSRSTNQPSEPMVMIAQFLDSHGFLDYLESGLGSDENNDNLLDKLQDALGRGQNPLSILPSILAEPEIVTISDPDVGVSGSGAKYTYDRFPSNVRTEEQEEKRKQILAAVNGAIEYSGRQTPSSPSISSLERANSTTIVLQAERERMVLDIKVKLQQGLWLRLLKLEAGEDPLSSFEYGTILGMFQALIESDAEGIGGSGFVECIREHINSGWHGQLTEEQFIAVKELVLKTAISRATSRNDVLTIRDALEVSAEMYKKDANNVPDYVQRHLISLSIWEELRYRFWEGYFDYLVEQSSDKVNSANYAALVTAQLALIIFYVIVKAGLGLPDNDAWYIIETIAERNNIGYKLIKLRGLLSHIHQLRINYWGVSSGKPQSLLPPGLSSPRLKDAADENQEPLEADTSSRTNSFSRVRKWASDGAAGDMSSTGQKKTQTNVRILRGHSGPVTALHCVTRREVWDLVGDREDAGFFISGSTDCTVVKIWDPSLRGSELRATLQGHTTIRAISSDRGKVVSGSDDLSVIVWDKQTTQLLEELKGHDAQVVSCVRMLSGERVLTAAHDGTVKMWDVRTDTCVATVGRCSSAVLCMEYDDTSGILAAAGRDSVANIWDIRAGRQMHKLLGHTKWIRRSIRMVGDTLITGSDDWTARVWTVSRGTCDAVLACHAGPLLCVEYSASDKGIITGSTDGLLRFWENDEGKCNAGVNHYSSLFEVCFYPTWLWLGVGAADNSMSLFQRPPNIGSKMSGWQLYRTPQKTNAVVRCVVSDLERKRICSGGRNGVLRLWEATINI